MSSQSTQRSRKPQGVAPNAPTHSQQQLREASPSPSYRDRQRTIRASSMSVGTSGMQPMFGSGMGNSQGSLASGPVGRRSPSITQLAQRRPLSPPNPHNSIAPLQLQDLPYQQQTPSPKLVAGAIDTSHPQPKNEAASRQFLATFRTLERNAQFTDQLLADLQNAGSNGTANGSKIPGDAPGSASDLLVKQKTQSSPRTSRDFHSSTLNNEAISPEKSYLPSNETHTQASKGISAAQPNRQSRPPPLSTNPRSPLTEASNSPLQSPRGLPQVKSPRSPVRSLPVQEEVEDLDSLPERRPLPGSPTPSSDINPLVGGGARTESTSVLEPKSGDGDLDTDQGNQSVYTTAPKSPISLPDPEYYHFMQYLNSLSRGGVPPPPPPLSVASRRPGSSDHLGFQGLEAALLEQQPHGRYLSHGNPPTGFNTPPPIPFSPELQRPFSATTDGDYNPALAYLQAYLTASPRPPTSAGQAGNARPEAPIPPTPHSQSVAPSPSSFVGGPDPRQSSSFVPRPAVSGSPYPFPYGHLRRNMTYMSSENQSDIQDPALGGLEISGRDSVAVPPADLDPASLHASLVRQWQMYAQNNWAQCYSPSESDSTLSPASPHNANRAHLEASRTENPRFTGWAQWHTSKLLGMKNPAMLSRGNPRPSGGLDKNGKMVYGDDATSIRSSPSHEPIPLPAPPMHSRFKKKGEGKTASQLRNDLPARSRSPLLTGVGGRTVARRKPPPRADSTQPRETTPEPISSGEETSVLGEEQPHFSIVDEGPWINGPALPFQHADIASRASEEADGEWIDEDEDENEHDSDELQSEYHRNFVSNVERRRRRWEIGWDGLIQAFKTLDRQTDATMILLASPSHSTKKHHLLTSRSIRRSLASTETNEQLQLIKRPFNSLATRRRMTRTLPVPLSGTIASTPNRFRHPLISASSSSSSGKQGQGALRAPALPTLGASPRDDDLRHVLETAMGSLETLRGFYEEREVKWREEMKKVDGQRQAAEERLKEALSTASIDGEIEAHEQA